MSCHRRTEEVGDSDGWCHLNVGGGVVGFPFMVVLCRKNRAKTLKRWKRSTRNGSVMKNLVCPRDNSVNPLWRTPYSPAKIRWWFYIFLKFLHLFLLGNKGTALQTSWKKYMLGKMIQFYDCIFLYKVNQPTTAGFDT